MPDSIQVIGSVNVSGTVHPVDKVFTLLSGISTVAGSSSSSSYKSVRWYVSGIEGVTEPYNGMKIAVKVPLAGVGTAGAVLSINGNVDAKYHPLAYNVNTVLTTHFPVNSIKMFTYDANQTMDCYLTSGTKVTVTGVWKAESNYDSNTTYTVASGDSNGQIKVTPSGGNAYNVDVKGLGAAAYKAVDTSVTSGSANLVTSGAVYTAINNLPKPMVFKGTLGTGGTITTLPTASTSEGYTYKVITAGTYTGQAASVGDMFICGKPEGASSYSWILIPAGDEPEGTVTSVGLSMPTGFSVANTPITSSGTLTVTFESGYSLPTTAKQTAWDGKYAKPSGGIPKTDLASAVQTSLGKADTAVQSITATGDATGTATVSSGAASIGLTLKNSGVSAGTYSAVTVNAKGIVTAGAQMIEVGAAGQSAPSANLAVGGIFFKQI